MSKQPKSKNLQKPKQKYISDSLDSIQIILESVLNANEETLNVKLEKEEKKKERNRIKDKKVKVKKRIKVKELSDMKKILLGGLGGGGVSGVSSSLTGVSGVGLSGVGESGLGDSSTTASKKSVRFAVWYISLAYH